MPSLFAPSLPVVQTLTTLLPRLRAATLPHEKFYNMDEYERRMTALRAGEYVPPADDGYDPTADMRAHASTHKRRAVEHDSYMNKEQLMELRKVQNERIQVRWLPSFRVLRGRREY